MKSLSLSRDQLKQSAVELMYSRIGLGLYNRHVSKGRIALADSKSGVGHQQNLPGLGHP